MEIIDLEKPKQAIPEIQTGFFVAEVVFFVLGMLGLLFKIMHWPGASFMLIIGLGFFTVLLFPIGLFYKYWQMKVINGLMASTSIGILYKLMGWPKFQSYLHIGAITALVAIVFFGLLNMKQAGFIKNNKFITFRILSLSAFVLFLSIMNARTYYLTFVAKDHIGATLYEKMSDEPNSDQARSAYLDYRKSQNIPYSLDSTNVPK